MSSSNNSIDHNINPDLSDDQKNQLLSLLEEYSDIFAESTSRMGYTDLVTHSIETPEANPRKIFSTTFDEHLVRLRNVFNRLRSAGLTLKPTKCTYARTQVNLLGHVISAEGIKPDPDKLNAISKFPIPNSVKKDQSFLGLANYCRKFIANFKNTKYLWGPEQNAAFETLKAKLLSAPVLTHFNPEAPKQLHVDASGIGIGGVLLQEHDSKWHSIAYISRSLTKVEQNYTISELEALAVVWSLGYLRHLIFGRPITIITDHNAICFLKTLKSPTGKFARWIIKLSEFDYVIKHKSGAAHRDADCLSRNPVQPPTEHDVDVTIEVPTYLLENQVSIEIPSYLLENHDIVQLQQEDPKILEIINALKDPENSPIGLVRRSKNFILENDLYRKNTSLEGLSQLLVIPSKLKHELSSGHLGFTKTYCKIRNRFYWDGLSKDVEKYVKVSLPFDCIGIDLLGPFRRSRNGNTMIIVATDYATRWAETRALPTGEAGPVAKFLLENVMLRHGVPTRIRSDRGKCFQAELVAELLKITGAKSSFSTAYHPQFNGLTERFNRTLADMLSLYTNTQQTDWDSNLPLCTWAYNTSRQGTTKVSPFFLVYAREPRLATEASLNQDVRLAEIQDIRDRALMIRNYAVENIHSKQHKDKQRYDSTHRDVHFNIGDQVRVFTPIRKVGKSEKLLLRWFGPYTVEGKCGEVDYLVRMGPSKVATVHVSRILPYCILLFFIALTSATTPVRISSGAFWKKLPDTITYSATIPLVYQTRWQADKPRITERIVDALCNGVDSRSRVCRLGQDLEGLSAIIERELHLLHNAVNPQAWDIPPHIRTMETPDESDYEYVTEDETEEFFHVQPTSQPRRYRHRRALDFIGDFFSWCCGVATEHKVDTLQAEDHHLQELLQKLNSGIQRNLREISNNSQSFQSYQDQVAQNFLDTRDKIKHKRFR
ncbi:hypothetical protein ILUMI_05372 [Ignelater luminosus]|uniref:RNA-directed DNA polymerase n=1 Tax=Ignelater luminosus TaxID=2038154 RepID=A0A8K0D7F7_IGNLU|nr:hypothetical protein ILUMI_05372 [Ignelater luminosus]